MDERRTQIHEFNTQVTDYSEFVAADAVRNDLHYPAVMAELGGIRGKKVLDVGCGDGLLTRKLAKNGATVTGYDQGENLIQSARQSAVKDGLEIQFQTADARTFMADQAFDYATSVMVLPYAGSEEDLQKYFESTQRVLAQGGKFVSIVLNPDFRKYGDSIPNRIMTPLGDRKVKVEFLDPKTGVKKFGGVLDQFSKEIYETAARNAGFSGVAWKPVLPAESGKQLKENFWKNVETEQPYSLLVAEK